MNGYGEYHWPEGRSYIGNYVMDKRHGFGIHYWSNPEKLFMGFWENNKQNGVGCIITMKSIVYGVWHNGEKQKSLSGYEAFIKKLPSNLFDYSNFFPKDIEEGRRLIKLIR